MVNFFAPWCFWSQKLVPAWEAVGRRLHARAYSQSFAFVRVDCTSAKGRDLCRSHSIHAFPTVRTYRGSVHAFEPYEYGREENVIWLHMVKIAAEVVVQRMHDVPAAERERFATQIEHISADLKAAMERRREGLDEDWSEDALGPEEEVAEDRELLAQIDDAASSILAAKGVDIRHILRHAREAGSEGAEARAVRDASSDHVLALLADGAKQPPPLDEDGSPLEMWEEEAGHEGCNLFGYVEVSRAPGTIHLAPHSSRHSFDFSHVNTSHHIDHLSFGLELGAIERRGLPPDVRKHLLSLDGRAFTAATAHLTQEHHVNIVPTRYQPAGSVAHVETYQFTATSHARTKDTLPSLLISYDVSPIQVNIAERRQPTSELVLSFCAIIGGVVAVFGIIDGMPYTGSAVVRQKLSAGKLH